MRLDSPRARRVLDRVRATPAGFVRAYGDVSPGAPRFAGAVLAACEDPALPWHRIVRADGSLAKGAGQRARLEAEGVPFRGTRVEMRLARLPAEVIEAAPAPPGSGRGAPARGRAGRGD
jgi:alkylated DNA nucleotide flippase Atl1